MVSPYDIAFGRAYSTNTDKNIDFNKGGDTELVLTVNGTLGLPSGFSITGSLTPFKRVTPEIGGVINLNTSLVITGGLNYRKGLTLAGAVHFPPLKVVGSLTVEKDNSISLEGVVRLPSKVRVKGTLHYDEDVYRGLRSGVEVLYREAIAMPPSRVSSTFRKAVDCSTTVRERFSSSRAMSFELSAYFTGMLSLRFPSLAPFTAGVGVVQAWKEGFSSMHRLRLGVEEKALLATPITIFACSTYTDLLRLRCEWEFYYQETVKKNLELRDTYRWGVPLRSNTQSYWREAVKIITVFLRRPVIPPIYEQPKAEDFNLRFKCPYRAKNKKGYFNIYFGMSRCKKPYIIPPEGTYMTENTFSAKRLADGQPFSVLSCAVDTDLSSWCWSGSFVIPASHLEHVKAISGQLPLVELTINGDQYVILVESFNRARKFNDDTYTVKGRSLSALLDEPHSSPITYTNKTEISAVQLIQQLVADTVGDTLTVYWADLVSDIGWVLPPESVSFSNQSVIKAVASIVEPVGGVVFTHPSQPVLVIKKAYPYAHWETPLVIDHTLAEDIIEDEGTAWTRTTSKNGVYVVDPVTGDTVKVLRRGTAGEVLDAEVSTPIVSTHEARVSAGKHALTKANTAETRSLTFPFLPQMHHLYPADTLCVTTSEGQDWGTINAVGINVSVDDQGYVDVNYAVGVTRFMETGIYG